MPTLDTLVHISAPATTENDHRYAKQAMAYRSGFESTKRHGILTARPSRVVPSTSERPSSRHGFIGQSITLASPGRSQVNMGPRALAWIQETPGLHEATQSMSSRIVKTPSANLPQKEVQQTPSIDSTQQIFNSQYLTVSIETQSSVDETVPFSSVESARRAKRRKISKDALGGYSMQYEKSHSFQVSASIQNSVQSVSTHGSSQYRRDSQSAEVSSPEAEQCPEETGKPKMTALQTSKPVRNLSPSSAMEQEIEAFKTLRYVVPTYVRDQGLSGSQLEEFISSILPDSYGLSQSDIDGKEDGHQEADNLPSAEGRIESEPIPTSDDRLATSTVLLTQDPTRRYSATRYPNGMAQLFCNEQVITAAEQSIAMSDVQADSFASAQSLYTLAPSQRANKSELRNQHNKENVQPENTQKTTIAPGLLSSVSIIPTFTPLVSPFDENPPTNAVMSLRVPKPTELPPISRDTRYPLSSPPREHDLPTAKTLPPHPATHSNTFGQNDKEIFKALKATPRHIFPKSEPEGINDENVEVVNEGNGEVTSDANGEASAEPHPDVAAQLPVNAERHMLYRRQRHRDLDPIERGYWTVSLTPWNPAFQLQFLEDLQKHIGDKKLGAGSWADVHFTQSGLPEKVDVYCGVPDLGNVWLLLQVISETKLTRQDMHWIGWDGKPALSMPAKVERDVIHCAP